ncbi:MAG: hypothetical protein MRQ09_05670, partial [Candidatus Midichloria sp.]|nr:hypothetical protein [Candidatus Midichloria sp.]
AHGKIGSQAYSLRQTEVTLFELFLTLAVSDKIFKVVSTISVSYHFCILTLILITDYSST